MCQPMNLRMGKGWEGVDQGWDIPDQSCTAQYSHESLILSGQEHTAPTAASSSWFNNKGRKTAPVSAKPVT